MTFPCHKCHRKLSDGCLKSSGIPEKFSACKSPLTAFSTCWTRIEMCHQSRMWRTGPFIALRTRFGSAGSPSEMTATGRSPSHPSVDKSARSCFSGDLSACETKPKRRQISGLSILPTTTSRCRFGYSGRHRICAPSRKTVSGGDIASPSTSVSFGATDFMSNLTQPIAYRCVHLLGARQKQFRDPRCFPKRMS